MAAFSAHCRNDHDGIVTEPLWNGVPERGEGPLGTQYDFDTGTYAEVAKVEKCRSAAEPVQMPSGSRMGPV